MRSPIWIAMVAAALLAFGGTCLAGKPGGGGGKPGGGGGEDPPPPPPDPVIAYFLDGDLMVMNADGTNQSTVLAGASGAYDNVDCCWSPDGTRIAFRGSIQGDGIYVVGLDGSGLTKIFVNDAQHYSFALKWSPAPAPDGDEKIAFNMTVWDDKDRWNEVWVVNPDGEDLQNLTKDLPTMRTEARPTWSPDGSQLAAGFIELVKVGDSVARTAAGLEVYDLVEDGEGGIKIGGTTEVFRETVNPDAVNLGDLDWARSGRKVVYAARTADNDNRDIYVLDMDAPSTVYQVTNTPDFDESEVSWSPSGDRITYRLRGYKKDAKLSGIWTVAFDPLKANVDATMLQSNGEQPDWLCIR